METQRISAARKQAFYWHEGQMYGQFPYCFHLMHVVQNLLDYGYNDEELVMAGYLHDTIEDCNISRDTIRDLYGSVVENLVWAVTGFGENRKEKKRNMIAKLEDYPKAIPLKMADRLANIKNCALYNRRLLDMYKKEMADYQALFEGHNDGLYQKMMEYFE